MSNYNIGPVQQKTLIMGLRSTQVFMITVAVFGAILFVSVIPGRAGLILAMFLVAGAVGFSFATVGGRPIDGWIPSMMKFGRATIKKETRSFNAGPHEGHVIGQLPKSDPPPPLKGVRIMKVATASMGEVGIIKDTLMGTYSAVLQLGGQSFGLLDGAEQEMKLSSWGGALAACAREGSPLYRLQWIERTLPEVGDAMAQYFSETAVMDVEHPLADSYVDLISSAGPVTQQHVLYLVVAISARKAARQIRKVGKGDSAACEVLLREVRAIDSLLRGADVTVIKTLDAYDVSNMFRTAFDPTAVNEIADRAMVDPDYRGASVTHAWPMATEEKWDMYRTDNRLHASFWIAQWPRTESPADFFAPIVMQTRATRTLSVTMEPVPPSKAIRQVESAHTSFIADDDLRARAGYMTTARRSREYDGIVRRESELADGHALFRFSGWVTVTSDTPETLDFSCTDVEQAAYQSRLEMRRMYGEQAFAFTCNLPLARGLR